MQVTVSFVLLSLNKRFAYITLQNIMKSAITTNRNVKVACYIFYIKMINILFLQLWLLQKSREDSWHTWDWWRNTWILYGRSLAYSPGAGPLPRWTPFLLDKIITHEASEICIKQGKLYIAIGKGKKKRELQLSYFERKNGR